MKKGIAALVCAGMITLTGCYGSNACFNKLHDWNGTLGNKWLNSIVHFFLMIFGIYGICLGLIDGLVLNTVEFWTGSNPLAGGDSYFEQDAQGNSIAAVKNADGTMSVELTTAAGEKANLTLERDADVVRALDEQGNLVAQYELNK
ncbi:MAG: DUF3332 domain-containing protein [Fibrobacter sp.]|nr:DUF3332 domain-containing protein [Fibrobacter sp.]MCQ2121157.1 DUF3332 domain-containing protein [Fibrobacter sp.]